MFRSNNGRRSNLGRELGKTEETMHLANSVVVNKTEKTLSHPLYRGFKDHASTFEAMVQWE